jgi:hypothetical protein
MQAGAVFLWSGGREEGQGVIIQRSSVIICCGTSWAVAFQCLCSACRTTFLAISSRQCSRRETTRANSRCSRTSPSTRRRDVHSSSSGARWGHTPTHCVSNPSWQASSLASSYCRPRRAGPVHVGVVPSPIFQWARG